MWSFKENAKEITSWTYLFPVAQVASSAHQIGTGALIITSNYVLGIWDLIFGIDSICLFDLSSKDENWNVSSSGTAVF